MKIKRVFLIVLDSVGIGEMPDAHLWGDEGSNTVGAIRRHPDFSCPNLKELGFFNIDTVGGGTDAPTGSFARMHEASKGKDTTIGHWEIAGIYSPRPLPTYPEGFPKEVIEEFENRTEKGTLCNLPYSGTDVIRDFGEEHLKTGNLIVYTSADSVFQIAAHEDIVPIEELYRYCEIARELTMRDEWKVGRVIARPYVGKKKGEFKRTANRHDYALAPFGKTVLNSLKENNFDVVGVGKIGDIFNGSGITESFRNKSNHHGMEQVIDFAKNKEF
jgi:phosphopentomutase